MHVYRSRVETDVFRWMEWMRSQVYQLIFENDAARVPMTTFDQRPSVDGLKSLRMEFHDANPLVT